MQRHLSLPVDDLFDIFPVPIEAIARRYYGIEIHRRWMPDSIAGILHKLPGRSYLYLNAAHSRQRQRWTIAHEIAHQRLHPIGVYMSGPGRDTRGERTADMWAAEMLMPAAEVRRCLREGMSFEDMIEWFDVSKEAMRLRIQEIVRQELSRPPEYRAIPQNSWALEMV